MCAMVTAVVDVVSVDSGSECKKAAGRNVAYVRCSTDFAMRLNLLGFFFRLCRVLSACTPVRLTRSVVVGAVFFCIKSRRWRCLARIF